MWIKQKKIKQIKSASAWASTQQIIVCCGEEGDLIFDQQIFVALLLAAHFLLFQNVKYKNWATKSITMSNRVERRL